MLIACEGVIFTWDSAFAAQIDRTDYSFSLFPFNLQRPSIVAKSQSHCRFAGARAAHDLRCVATIADALRALADLLNFLQCVANLGTHGARIDGAGAKSPISGGDVFNLQIVATMQANGVR